MMLKNGWRKILPTGILAAHLVIGPAAPALGEREVWEGMPAAADRELDGMRGGFVDRDGVRVLFGIEQAIFVDGMLQAVTRLNGEDGLAGLAASQPPTDAGIQILRLGQLPPLAADDLDPTRFLTVVQNTEDQRVIATLTRIDAVVHGLSALRDNRALHTLQDRMIDSLR